MATFHAVHEPHSLIENNPSESYLLLAQSFKRALLAQNKSPNTIIIYLDAVHLLWRFLREQGMPTEPRNIRREHVEAFIADLLQRPNANTGKTLKPATAANRYKSLQAYFKWLLDEGEIKQSPMERMKPPTV